MKTDISEMRFRSIGWVCVLATMYLLSTFLGSGATVVREDIEWSRLWVTGVNQTNRPHVLLIGDSITEGYAGVVERELQQEAHVARLATSKSLGDPAFLEEVVLALRNASFQVVHFNNGMHGEGYAEQEYQRDFPKLVQALRRGAPGARLVCATTTAKRADRHLEEFHPFNERIKARNVIARDVAGVEKIAIDDLFQLVENHQEYYSEDGTHFNQAGSDILGRQVAEVIRTVLQGGTPGQSQAAPKTGGKPPTITVKWQETVQTITGFGASGGNDSAAAILKLSPADRTRLMDLMFRADTGIGLTMVRNELYAFRIEPAPGVWDWSKDDDQIWLMKEAAQRGVTNFHSCSWSPPAWMKDNNNVKNGGRLKPECYRAFAELLSRYVREYKTRFGLEISGISPQNEPNYAAPYQGCVWSGAEFHDFIKDHLAPVFDHDGVKAKIILADTGDVWDFKRCEESLSDPATVRRVDVCSAHLYGPLDVGVCKRYDKAGDLGKEIWQTEASTIGKMQEDIGNGIYWAKAVHDALVNGRANAWFYWTFISPWNDSEGLATPSGDAFSLPKRFYCLGQWSRFVRPGSVRIQCSSAGGLDGVHISAFRNPGSGALVLVVINENSVSREVAFSLDSFEGKSVARWVTSETSDLEKQDVLPIQEHRLQTIFSPNSVTTLEGPSK